MNYPFFFQVTRTQTLGCFSDFGFLHCFGFRHSAFAFQSGASMRFPIIIIGTCVEVSSNQAVLAAARLQQSVAKRWQLFLPSDFGLLSAFGLRISDFSPGPL